MTTPEAPARPTSFEQAEIATVETLKPVFEEPAVQKVANVAKLGDEPPLLTLSALVLAAGLLTSRPRLRRAGVRMIAAHLIATAAKNFIKKRVDRTRPRLLDRSGYRMEPGRSQDKELTSFPSGHAAGAFAVARAASREYSIGRVAGFGAGVLSLLQVVRRAHYPSDAVAGAALGVLSEAVADRVLRPVLGQRKSAS